MSAEQKLATLDDVKTAVVDVVDRRIDEKLAAVDDKIEAKLNERFNKMPAVVMGGGAPATVAPGVKLGRFIRCVIGGHGSPSDTKMFAERLLKNSRSQVDEEVRDEINKALGVSDFTAGGVLAPQEFVAEIIEYLHKGSVAMSAGPRILPMANGSLAIPKQTGTSTAYWIGEGQAGTVSEPTFGDVVLTSKKLATNIIVSNELLESSSFNVDQILVNDITQQMASKIDLAFFRGLGSAYQPRGVYYSVAAAQIVASTGTTLAYITADLNAAIERVFGNINNVINGNWFMSSRSASGIRAAMNANAIAPYATGAVQGGLLEGYKCNITNNISNAVSSTYSEVYFVDMARFYVGETMNLRIQASKDAAYESGGSTYSAFQRNQTVINATTELDFALVHNQAASVISNVSWA